MGEICCKSRWPSHVEEPAATIDAKLRQSVERYGRKEPICPKAAGPRRVNIAR